MIGAAHHAVPLEAVATALEVAEMAWSALEHRRRDSSKIAAAEAAAAEAEDEAADLRSENDALRSALQENLALLRGLAQSPDIAHDCPPDLYTRLVAAADSKRFLEKLKSFHEESTPMQSNTSPFKKSTDLGTLDIVVNVDGLEPSLWVWVTEGVQENLEEASGIDNEDYMIINNENVVDALADFIAKCIIDNPKSKTLTPEQLQKSVIRALSGIKGRGILKKTWEAGKIIYALSTWGLALAGLYKHRAVLQMAAKGVHHTSKLVMKAL